MHSGGCLTTDYVEWFRTTGCRSGSCDSRTGIAPQTAAIQTIDSASICRMGPCPGYTRVAPRSRSNRQLADTTSASSNPTDCGGVRSPVKAEPSSRRSETLSSECPGVCNTQNCAAVPPSPCKSPPVSTAAVAARLHYGAISSAISAISGKARSRCSDVDASPLTMLSPTVSTDSASTLNFAARV